MKIVIYLILLMSIVINSVSCKGDIIRPDITDEGTQTSVTGKTPQAEHLSAVNLMENVTANALAAKPADNAFVLNTADFALELFKKSVSDDKNSMISPLSVLLALSMTANGADGNTLSQMQKVLGVTFNIDELNKYLRGYAGSLTSTDKAKLSIANSIWFRNDNSSIEVNPDFLQTNADYYNADAFSAAFDAQTLADINSWVSDKTDGLINSILDEIPNAAVMYLINAMVFDATWQDVYSLDQIIDNTFNAYDGTKQTAAMMCSREIKYLSDGKATGFIKPYADGQYSFVALLPNEDVSVQDYIASLTGESFIDTIGNAKTGIVNATLPKFTSEYKLEMNDALKSLGITDAFSDSLADFTKLGHSENGSIFINSVIHKTYISVDELGTKAGAVTAVEMYAGSVMVADYYTVTLDRPFVYAIIDNNTNLPLFIGSVLSINN